MKRLWDDRGTLAPWIEPLRRVPRRRHRSRPSSTRPSRSTARGEAHRILAARENVGKVVLVRSRAAPSAPRGGGTAPVGRGHRDLALRDQPRERDREARDRDAGDDDERRPVGVEEDAGVGRRAGLAGDDRADDGEADRAADLERGLHEARGQALLVVADAVGRLRCSGSGSSARTRGRAAASSAGARRRRTARSRCRAAPAPCSPRRARGRRGRSAARCRSGRRAGRCASSSSATSRPAGRKASAVSIADQPLASAGTGS